MDIMEMQRMILSHSEDGPLEMLHALHPMVPEHSRHKVEILIKCMELMRLLERGRNGYRGAV